jgi:hypothetical protein
VVLHVGSVTHLLSPLRLAPPKASPKLQKLQKLPSLYAHLGTCSDEHPVPCAVLCCIMQMPKGEKKEKVQKEKKGKTKKEKARELQGFTFLDALQLSVQPQSAMPLSPGYWAACLSFPITLPAKSCVGLRCHRIPMHRRSPWGHTCFSAKTSAQML